MSLDIEVSISRGYTSASIASAVLQLKALDSKTHDGLVYLDQKGKIADVAMLKIG